MEIQAFILGDVVANARQQHQIVETLCHPRVEIGRKETCDGGNCLRRPEFGFGEIHDLFPIAQTWYNLDGFRQFTRFVAIQQYTNSIIQKKGSHQSDGN